MRRRQQGVALITAMLVVALAAIAATALLSSANLALHRTQNLQESEQAWWYAEGVEGWVRTVLAHDAELNRYDGLGDIWARAVDYLPIGEGVLRGHIVDLQGRFNLNNLAVTQPQAYEKQLLIFTRLAAIAAGLDDYQARGLGAAIRDYIDADNEPTGGEGAEDSAYLSLKPPRRVANQAMQSVTELLAVAGVTPEIYARLAPHLTALPVKTGGFTTINVNTATPALLQALTSAPGAGLEQFIAERAKHPVETVSELFGERNVYSANAADNSLLSVSSEYFQLNAEIFIGSSRFALYSLYRRAGAAAPVVLRHSSFTE
ncbi:general secretion pathway protein K [Solimonas aquatica]|uniref:Type II secretion system protein K n=1 Tax=Solimonas aquatica TaxID=489703 RepID=A0A1H9HU69_9GAMM|nr:type II secretion system minor pseudopilin GspK [Solimonas aquatica]SEQ65861.1 general secretion pathway protein K [Solimonas aquatica]